MVFDPSSKKYKERIERIKAANVHSMPKVPPPVNMFPEEAGPFFAYGAVVINTASITYFEYVKDKPTDPAPNLIKIYLVSAAFVTIPISFKSKLLADIKYKEE